MTERSQERKAKFCKERCPVCKRARTRGGIARWFVKNIDRPVCPYCKAYEQVYGFVEHTIPLGSDFISGTTYTVVVNDVTATFVAQ